MSMDFGGLSKAGSERDGTLMMTGSCSGLSKGRWVEGGVVSVGPSLRIADEAGGPDSRRGTGVGERPVDTDTSRGKENHDRSDYHQEIDVPKTQSDTLG